MSIKKRFICLALAVTMALPVLSSCKDKGAKYDPNNFIADTTNPQIVKEKVKHMLKYVKVVMVMEK